MSLRWKIPTSPHFSVQTDNSLINELLQPRPMGVATLAPAAGASALPAGEPGQPWETDRVSLPVPSQQQRARTVICGRHKEWLLF